MLKALFKKQLLELCAFYFQDKKTGKMRSHGKTALFIGLFAFLFLYLGAVFFMLGMTFLPFLESEYPWMYFTMMGMIAVAFGTFGSVFNTYSSLYHAKDNDLLLSLPIPPAKILFARMAGVALMGFFFEAIVIIPALLVRFIFAPVGVAEVIFSCLLLPVLTALITVLSCLLGWIVALIASRCRNKSILTVALSLIFLAAYFYFFSRSSDFVEMLLQNTETVSGTLRGWCYPFYLMGCAAEGDALAMLIFCAGVAVLFLLTCRILSRTFIGITTYKSTGKRAVYREKQTRSHGMTAALLGREWRHYLASPIYILNCSLGTLFMIPLAVLAWIKADEIRGVLAMLGEDNPFAVVLALAAVAMIGSMNNLTAPSVSLEGKNLWLVQSLPVPTEKVLDAKQLLHVVLTLPPTWILTAALAAVIRASVVQAIFMMILAVLFVMLASAIGLALNLKMPNLNWKDESVPVKQSVAVIIALFSGWGIGGVLTLAGYFSLMCMNVTVFLSLATVLFGACLAVLNVWIRKKGSEIFAGL